MATVARSAGYFVVKAHKVEDFAISESCLGKVGADSASVFAIPNMKVTFVGKFSFKGKAKRTSESGESPVSIDLTGKFVTATKAKVSLTISYGHCGTKHATIVRHG